MLIRLKSSATQHQYRELLDYLEREGYEVKKYSTDESVCLSILKDAASLDADDVRAFDAVEEVVDSRPPYRRASRALKPEDTVVDVGGVPIGGERTRIIAGPCSVEDEGQMHRIATHLGGKGVFILRGGAYKPRTSPYAFQGLGEKGLKLLRGAADSQGMRVVSEVPAAELIERLDHYVDMYQVGARNMHNTHLLKALGRTNKPVLIKRAPSATIEEWLLAAEYVLAGGNPSVVLVERGIRSFARHVRYTLDVSAIPIIKELSHLPVLVDPSHAAGRRRLVPPLAQAALAAGADGLLIEVHDKPSLARSDGAQSLDFDGFDELHAALQSLAAVLGRPLD